MVFILLISFNVNEKTKERYISSLHLKFYQNLIVKSQNINYNLSCKTKVFIIELI